MKKTVVAAVMVGGLPVLSLEFPIETPSQELFNAAESAVAELVGASTPFPACEHGHPRFKFENGATACTFFERDRPGVVAMRMIFHQPPPPECALMLLLRTPNDTKGMN